MAMRPRLRPYVDYFIVLCLLGACYLLFFHRLGGIGLLGPDEPRYASVAREMYLTGDYVTPRLNDAKWFEKPALMYWLAAAGYKLFGINEWGARFPSALAATVTVFFIYWCGRRLWDPVGLVPLRRARARGRVGCRAVGGLVRSLLGVNMRLPLHALPRFDRTLGQSSFGGAIGVKS